MTHRKSLVAALAAGSLLVGQTALAAAPRTGSDVASAESLAGTPPGAWVGIAPVLLLLTIFGIIALTEDDDDNFPASP